MPVASGAPLSGFRTGIKRVAREHARVPSTIDERAILPEIRDAAETIGYGDKEKSDKAPA